MDSDSYLSVLQRDWLAAGLHVKSYWAYERLETYGVIVVSQPSATNLCNQRLDPIHANHIEIVKPLNERSVPYLAFKAAYQATSLTAQERAAQAPPEG